VTTFAAEQENSAEYVLKIISHARVKIIYGNRAVCKIRGKPRQNNAKAKATGVVEPSTSSPLTGGVEGRRGNSFTHHAMSVCRLSGSRPLKTISEKRLSVYRVNFECEELL